MLRKSGEHTWRPGLALGCMVQCTFGGLASGKHVLSGTSACSGEDFSPFLFLVLIECRVLFMLSKHTITEPHPSLMHVAINDELPQSARVIVIDSVCVCVCLFLCLCLCG